MQRCKDVDYYFCIFQIGRRNKNYFIEVNVTDSISISDIYEKNVNFLIGSGASYGLFPTLALGIKGDGDGSKQTIETLATQFAAENDDDKLSFLFAHYFERCIKPAMLFDLGAAIADPNQRNVIENYQKFITTILIILQRKRQNKFCNVFTTNYDGCLAQSADQILQNGELDFTINDGAFGFERRIVQAKNFNTRVFDTRIFERHQNEIPQINLIHLHGSVYWRDEDGKILVNYRLEENAERCERIPTLEGLDAFSGVLTDPSKKISDLPKTTIKPEDKKSFWDQYNKLPIVNPTKWKFHETVFEEHYYQMLRHLSYELEKPDTVFITFGFSFADEHVLNLVKRSLSNPTLQLFICCFDNEEFDWMKSTFKIFKNVSFVKTDGNLDFKEFNQSVFSLEATKENTPVAEAVGGA